MKHILCYCSIYLREASVRENQQEVLWQQEQLRLQAIAEMCSRNKA
jgi:hypothetical protein